MRDAQINVFFVSSQLYHFLDVRPIIVPAHLSDGRRLPNLLECAEPRHPRAVCAAAAALHSLSLF